MLGSAPLHPTYLLTMTPTVRFAPSPTGRLHLGNARTAVVNWLFARKHGGRLILRLDDTDRERSRPEHEAAIREDLRWLGLGWDAEARQSDRAAVHAAAFERLRAAGHVYPCYETPDELAAKRAAQLANGQPPRYDRAALALTNTERTRAEAAGRRPHWRFLLPDEPERLEDLVHGSVEIPLAASLSDPVVRREDGSPTYLFASIVDDLDLGVTHVVRGEDHLTNTGPQLAIARALDASAVPAFAHLPLLQDVAGAKLSKRAGALSLAELREAEVEPAAVLALLATLGTGRAPPPSGDPDALLRDFDLAAYGTGPPKLDPDDLGRLTAAVLHHAPFAAMADRLAAAGLAGADESFWLAVRPNLARLSDARAWWEVCHRPLAPVVEDGALLAVAADLLPEVGLPDAEAAAAWLKTVGSATGRRGRALYHPLRLALTAREHGPELKHLLPLLGRERTLRRLRGETA